LTGEVSHTRAESAAPGQALRSRDSMCGRAVPRGVPPACRAIARDPTCTACRGNGLGVRLRRRRTQAHDEMPPRRAVREGPTFAHGAQPGGHGASPPHRTWPSRSPCRRSSDLHPARSSTGIRCTDSAVTIVIEWIEPGLTTVARGVAASTRMRRDSACRPRSPACLSHAQKGVSRVAPQTSVALQFVCTTNRRDRWLMEIHSSERAGSASSGTATGAMEVRAEQNFGDVGIGGWAAQRLAVVEQAGGICARCGRTGADTAFRSWDSAQLLAAHTRCVVGLGPAITTPTR